MKVVHLVQTADPAVGGSLVVARALCAAQRALGVEAELWFLYASPEDGSASREAGCRSLGIPRERRMTLGIRVLARGLRESRPDVIHHHDGLLWTRLVSAGAGAGLVTHGHLGAPRTRYMSKAHVAHWLARRFTHRLIAISAWTADSWADSGFPRERIRIVPNGVDTARFRRLPDAARDRFRRELGVPATARILLWAGRLDRETKGLDRLVRVAESLPKSWCCLVAGDGPDRAWLAQELHSRGLDDTRVRMLGKLPAPESVFGISDAFLFTSHREPFGLVLLEAAASELPILAFACEGGANELLEELGVHLLDDARPQDAGVWLAGLGDAPRNPAARCLAQTRYSWDRTARKTLEAYRELVGLPGRSTKRRASR